MYGEKSAKSENTAQLKGTFGLMLTYNIKENATEVKLSNFENIMAQAKTEEERVNAKKAYVALEELKYAQSFLEVIELTNGKMQLISHSVNLRGDEEIHYFVFNF